MDKKSAKNKSGDIELERQGWRRQFVAGEPRLTEAVEVYKSLGYEVRLEPPFLDKASEECKKCLLHQDCSKYKTIYIRHKKEGCEEKENAIVP